MRLRLPILLLVVFALTAGPARAAVYDGYDPANEPPFGGEPVLPRHQPASLHGAPHGFHLDGEQATRIANATSTVRDERASHPAMRPTAYTRDSTIWQVSYYDRGTEVAQVLIADRTGEVLEAWTGHQIDTKLARGYEDAVGGNVSEAYIWIPMCLLFFVPFFDRKRPFRLLHLDLLVLLGFGVSQFFFNKGDIDASVPLVYPVLGYLFARMLWVGVRPCEDPGPLIPAGRVRWLVIGAVALAAFHVALNVIDGKVIDIGLAGVVGADRIGHGQALYEGMFSPGSTSAATSTGRSTTSPTSRSSSCSRGAGAGTRYPRHTLPRSRSTWGPGSRCSRSGGGCARRSRGARSGSLSPTRGSRTRTRSTPSSRRPTTR